MLYGSQVSITSIAETPKWLNIINKQDQIDEKLFSVTVIHDKILYVIVQIMRYIG